MKRVIQVFLLVLVCFTTYGQDREADLLDDSTFLKAAEDAQLFQEVSELDPKRAALMAAVFPGLGQIYNKQYWKVPIVVTGMILFGHFINYNNKVYHALRNAALIANDGGVNPYESIITSENGLIRNRDIFRRNRDFLIVLGTAFYLLQIVDAHVSAHLDEFNVNEDLAMGIRPSIQPTPLFSQAVGISFVLKF